LQRYHVVLLPESGAYWDAGETGDFEVSLYCSPQRLGLDEVNVDLSISPPGMATLDNSQLRFGPHDTAQIARLTAGSTCGTFDIDVAFREFETHPELAAYARHTRTLSVVDSPTIEDVHGRVGVCGFAFTVLVDCLVPASSSDLRVYFAGSSGRRRQAQVSAYRDTGGGIEVDGEVAGLEAGESWSVVVAVERPRMPAIETPPWPLAGGAPLPYPSPTILSYHAVPNPVVVSSFGVVGRSRIEWTVRHASRVELFEEEPDGDRDRIGSWSQAIIDRCDATPWSESMRISLGLTWGRSYHLRATDEDGRVAEDSVKVEKVLDREPMPVPDSVGVRLVRILNCSSPAYTAHVWKQERHAGVWGVYTEVSGSPLHPHPSGRSCPDSRTASLEIPLTDGVVTLIAVVDPGRSTCATGNDPENDGCRVDESDFVFVGDDDGVVVQWNLYDRSMLVPA
jgi:hypothetical protein